MTKQEILKTHFGYDTFREGQEAVIDALLAEKDVLAVMPTGAGKSICYQVPALMMKGIPKQLPDTGTVFYSFALRKSRTLPYYLCGT